MPRMEVNSTTWAGETLANNELWTVIGGTVFITSDASPAVNGGTPFYAGDTIPWKATQPLKWRVAVAGATGAPAAVIDRLVTV